MFESIDSVNGTAAHAGDPQCCASCGCSHSSPAGGDEAFDVRREVIKLVAAAVLFAGVLLLEYTDVIRLPAIGFYVFISAAYLTAGVGILAAAGRTLVRGDFFDENVLMAIATLGAMAIGAFSEAVGVMIFYRAGEFLQGLAVSRSRRSIAALLAQRPDVVNLKTKTGISRVAPESVAVGSLVLVKPGEKIPLDGRITDGSSQVDTSALTGESVPRGAGAGDEVLAGGVNLSGTLTIAVTRPYDQSSIARMVELVENAAARKSATEQFITVFARYYTPAVVAAAAAVAFVPPMLIDGAGFQQWIYRALVLLVISCPCALVISIPLGYFGGIGRASRHGVLVKGSNYLDVLAKLHTVVFDKTGTLTEGVFEVNGVESANGYSAEQVLAFAARAEQYSNHPIARAIVKAFDKNGEPVSPEGVSGHGETSGSGVFARVDGRNVLVGSGRYLRAQGILPGRDGQNQSGTVTHVAVDGNYAGYIVISDRIRKESQKALLRLRQNGVRRIVMLTGDNAETARTVAENLGLDDYFADLLPGDKVTAFEKIQADAGKGQKVAFVGDGINDAPVIARADVGAAMGAAGSDAAIETADVVLMTGSPEKMADAVAMGKQTRGIVWQNIVLALSIKAVFIVLGVAGMATMWAAVFADVGTALLAVINSTRPISFDAAAAYMKR
ncbi:MAG: heavy metal translocating P-type ATPase [Desulfosalsimonas sp.]|uniref:heavy metal translocating P-type ATPase n=1 Tax=Desulfosalsimonas sp. TaxID=3073848 RepID=UPI003970A9D9